MHRARIDATCGCQVRIRVALVALLASSVMGRSTPARAPWHDSSMPSAERSFPVALRDGEDGFVVAECAAFVGCISQGRTREEALANIREAIALCLETETPAEIVSVEVAA